ncbi:dihydrolipoamide succinyltransferase, partial [Streptomyces sp. NPDC006984]
NAGAHPAPSLAAGPGPPGGARAPAYLLPTRAALPTALPLPRPSVAPPSVPPSGCRRPQHG